MDYQNSFLLNTDNIIAFILFMLILIILVKLLGVCAKSKMDSLDNAVSHQLLLAGTAGFIVPIIFNSSLQWEYSKFDNFLSIINFSSPFVLISFSIIIFYNYFRKTKSALEEN